MATYFSTAVDDRVVLPEIALPAAAPEPQTFDVAEWLPKSAPKTDGEAAVFVERLRPLVPQLVRSHRPKRQSEQDMVQLIFLKISRTFDQYPPTVPLVSRGPRVASNACLSEIAREKARPELRH